VKVLIGDEFELQKVHVIEVLVEFDFLKLVKRTSAYAIARR